MRCLRRVLGLTCVLVLSGIPLAAQVTVVVSPTHLGPWQEQSSTCGASNTGTTDFQDGPATPPLGTGSALLTVGSDGDSFNTFRYTGLDGVLLSQLTQLTYSTYVQAFGAGGQAPYLILNIDTDGDTTLDDQLFFEPVYQDGSYSGDPVPNQGTLTTGVWQPWDALAGGWWSLNAATFGPPLVTLTTYIAANPTARIINTSTGAGGFRVASGCGGAAWTSFVGNFDAVRIGVTGATTTFDFELTAPVPAIPTLSPWALLALIAALAGVAWRRLSSADRAAR